MSAFLCSGCGGYIDSDDDPDCFVEIGNMRRLHKEIILCGPCRDERYEMEWRMSAMSDGAIQSMEEYYERSR